MKRKRKGRADKVVLWIAILAILATVVGVGYLEYTGDADKVKNEVAEKTGLTSAPQEEEEDSSSPEPTATAEPSPSEEEFFPIIDERDPVDASYFEDAVFIGNSILNGLHENSPLSDVGTWLTKDGLDTANLELEEIETSEGTTTVFDALAEKQYGKVYIMLGTEEMNVNTEEWVAGYQEVLSQIKQLQPEATIYVMSVMPVSRIKADGVDYYEPWNISVHNQALFKVCWSDGYYYLDTYGEFADEDGYLPYEINTDGVNLTEEGYTKLYEYLLKRYAD